MVYTVADEFRGIKVIKDQPFFMKLFTHVDESTVKEISKTCVPVHYLNNKNNKKNSLNTLILKPNYRSRIPNNKQNIYIVFLIYVIDFSMPVMLHINSFCCLC